MTIEKNGLPLDDVEKDGWQDFIKEIIPLGLSQLFFFDGEKIQKMMSDDGNEELKKSILSLLGLDLVERLQADLKIYRSKFLKGDSTDSFAKEIAALEGQKELVEATIRKLNDDKASPENSIQQLTAKISDYRDKMSAQGEGYYRNRVSLEEKKRSLEHDIDSIKDKLRELAAGYLPVAIASLYALKLKKQIEDESKYKASMMLSENLKKKHHEMLAIIDSSGFLKMNGIDSTALKKIKSQLKVEIELLFSVETRQERQAEILELNGLEFKRIKLSQESTKKLQLFKSRTGLTPNIACRIALGISIAENNMPSLELFTEESGQEINRYTLFGEHELVLTSLFLQWCNEKHIKTKERNEYFLAHINRGVELLVNRVRGLENLSQLIKAS